MISLCQFLLYIVATPINNNRSPPVQGEADVDRFLQPDKRWCPWNSGSCTNTLEIPGQGTVEIMQRKSLPFELRMSNQKNPDDRNAYSITLSVNETEVKLSTSTGQSDTTIDPRYTLQPEDEYWHRYWISLFAINDPNVKYGIGEVRLPFSFLNIDLRQEESKSIKEIYYLHFRVNNNDNMLSELSDLKDDFRIYTGVDPILHELPLFVIPDGQFTTDHRLSHSAIPHSELKGKCRELYTTIHRFELNTPEFPDLSDVIAKSIKNPRGWCYKKLKEKAGRFGKPNPKATYLRITEGDLAGSAPGHNYVIEIWPPGHRSPIHKHSDTYSVIRVLEGEILARLYPALSLISNQYEPIEQICHKGSVTYILPNLNQTHQLKNVDSSGQPCITIQCYMYGENDRRHYEYFDYLDNTGQSIGHFDPKSDMHYGDFKARMGREKDNRFED